MKIKSGFDRVSAVIYFLMGCFFASNQLLVGHITAAFGASETQMGLMISSLYLGSLLMVLFFGEFAERAGKRTAAVAASSVVLAGSLMIFFAPSIVLVIIGFFVYGAGIGGFESNITSLVSDSRGAEANHALNLLQALFSTGAVAAPAVLAVLLKPDEYKAVYVLIALVFAAAVVYFTVNRKSIDSFAVKSEVSGGGGLTFLSLVKNPFMACYMLGMIMYMGTETVFTYWISDFFVFEGLSPYGAFALSAYWFASILGRLAGSRFRAPEAIIAPCFLLAAIGTLGLMFLPGAPLKIASVIVVGIAFGPLYASIALLGGNLFPDKTASAYSLMIFSGGVGGMLFQPVIGAFMKSGAVSVLYAGAAVICAASAAVMAVAFRKRRNSGTAA